MTIAVFFVSLRLKGFIINNTMTDGIRVTTHNFKYADWYVRFAGFLIDFAVVNLLVLLLVPGSFKVTNLIVGQRWPELMQFLYGLEGMWLWLAPLLYMTLMLGFFSRTAGMMVVKIRVANLDGTRISWLKAVFRTFGYILSTLILCLGFLPILFDKKRQGIHDRLTKTIVIVKR